MGQREIRGDPYPHWLMGEKNVDPNSNSHTSLYVLWLSPLGRGGAVPWPNLWQLPPIHDPLLCLMACIAIGNYLCVYIPLLCPSILTPWGKGLRFIHLSIPSVWNTASYIVGAQQKRFMSKGLWKCWEGRDFRGQKVAGRREEAWPKKEASKL